jgi:hypothetical protein
MECPIAYLLLATVGHGREYGVGTLDADEPLAERGMSVQERAGRNPAFDALCPFGQFRPVADLTHRRSLSGEARD